MHGIEQVDWTTTNELLAVAIDALRAANWQRGADPKKPSPKPEPLPRPGSPSRRRDRMSNEELFERLKKQRARLGR